MKDGLKRLLSCIFVIAFFFLGMCFDKMQAYSPEVSSYSAAGAQVYATDMPSVDDSQPCTSEMLGCLQIAASNLLTDRVTSRALNRIFHFAICGLGLAVSRRSSTFVTESAQDKNCSIAVIINYLHQTDGKKRCVPL